MKNDGGPAFPHPDGWRRNPQISDGMSLRDYLAAKAMPELQKHMLIRQNGSPGSSVVLDEIARLAYAQADAMLRVREEA